MTTYYTPTGNPIDLSRGTSSLVRNEFILIQTAFNSVDSTFTSVNALIGTKGNINGQTWTGVHAFPSTVSIGNVDSTEISYLDGVTSSIQGQFNTLGSVKSNKAGDSYTGSHDFTGATYVRVPTPSGIYDAVTKQYVDATAFNSALPGQAGNAGKFVTTNGTTASWAVVNTGSSLIGNPVSASNVAAVDFTGIDSTYDVYMLTYSKVVPSTDNARLQILTSSNGGSSFDTGATDYLYANSYASSNAGHAASVSGSANSMYLTPLGANGVESSSSLGGVSGVMYIHRTSGANYTRMTFHSHFSEFSGWVCNCVGGGARKSTTAANAIRFLFSTGNIASGEFKLYGLKKS